jgi:hypothetical protein
VSGAVLILGESMEAYHDSDCVSNSKLSVLEDGGPALYHGRFVAKSIPKPETTDALRLGCAFDTMLTEGRQEFARRYVVSPEGMKFSNKAGIEWKERHVTDEDKLIRWPEFVMMEAMERAVQADPLFRTFVHKAMIAQATVRMAISKYGVGVQSKPDWLSKVPCEFSGGRPYSINLKTTADWSDWFKDSDPNHPQTGSPVYTYGYHRQAALDQWCLFNVDEIGETAHFLLVIEKQEPFRVGWVQLTDEYLESGWREANAGLLRLKHCFATNSWPKTTGGVRALNPPRWLIERSLRADEQTAHLAGKG